MHTNIPHFQWLKLLRQRFAGIIITQCTTKRTNSWFKWRQCKRWRVSLHWKTYKTTLSAQTVTNTNHRGATVSCALLILHSFMAPSCWPWTTLTFFKTSNNIHLSPKCNQPLCTETHLSLCVDVLPREDQDASPLTADTHSILQWLL